MVTTENTVYTLRYSPADAIVAPAGTTSRWESNASSVDFQPISMELMRIIKGTQIPNSSYTLQHDLLTKLQTSRDGYIIQSALVDEDGYGITVNEAYLDFLSSIRDRYDSMRARQSCLSTHELQILHSLRHLLEPN